MVVGLAVLSPVPARAQEQTPSPKELWEAYPLDPDQAPATATPSSEFRASPSASPSPSPAASPDDGGMPWLVVLLLAAPLVFAAGLLIGHRRDRASRAPPAETAEPPAPKRFQWRDYPEPARPAPPPPPVPGARGPSFEAALEEEPAATPARSAQREPH